MPGQGKSGPRLQVPTREEFKASVENSLTSQWNMGHDTAIRYYEWTGKVHFLPAAVDYMAGAHQYNYAQSFRFGWNYAMRSKVKKHAKT